MSVDTLSSFSNDVIKTTSQPLDILGMSNAEIRHRFKPKIVCNGMLIDGDHRNISGFIAAVLGAMVDICVFRRSCQMGDLDKTFNWSPCSPSFCGGLYVIGIYNLPSLSSY